MNKGLVDLEKLRNNKKNADFRGKSAYCFINGDKIIKVYATIKDKGYFPLDRYSINDMSIYEADTIVFPEKYIYEGYKKAGEILKYINNPSIKDAIKSKIEVSKLIENYELVINDIMNYSNILMLDLCNLNVLYSDKSGFHIIDTTEWEIKDNSAKKNIFRFNSNLVRLFMEYIDLPIVYYYDKLLLTDEFKNKVCRFGKVGNKFCSDIESSIGYNSNLIDFLYSFQSLYYQYSKENINSLQDIKEFTKVLKKG